MKEVCVNPTADLDGARSGSPVYKTELEKVKTMNTHALSILFHTHFFKGSFDFDVSNTSPEIWNGALL